VSIRTEDLAGLEFSDVADAERIGPVTPGEVLREEFMAPLGLSGRALARARRAVEPHHRNCRR
jgi:antitoxin HigA-1